MKKLLLAIQFLTIIPIRITGSVTDRETGSATAFFPVAGLAEGTLFTISASLLMMVFPLELTNGFLILIMTAVNGGLHLDGLADTFDALASRGNRERKLSVMKSGTTGPAGVISITLALLLKYVILNALFQRVDLIMYYAFVFLMPVLVRWAIVAAILHGRSARQDGLGKIFIEHTGAKELVTATFFAVAICVGVLAFQSSILVFFLMFAMPVLYLSAVSAAWLFNRTLGGMTGDTFGAVHEIATLIFLTAGVIWSQKFI